MESLFRVDMRMSSVKIGAENRTFFDKYPVTPKAAMLALGNIEDIYRMHQPGDRAVWQRSFYDAFAGGLSENDRS